MENYKEDYGELIEYYAYVNNYLQAMGKEVEEETLNNIVTNYTTELSSAFGIDVYDDLDNVVKNDEILDRIVKEHTSYKYR